jgi:hypothetical protein
LEREKIWEISSRECYKPGIIITNKKNKINKKRN